MSRLSVISDWTPHRYHEHVRHLLRRLVADNMARAVGSKLFNPLIKLKLNGGIQLGPALASAGCKFYSRLELDLVVTVSKLDLLIFIVYVLYIYNYLFRSMSVTAT